MRAGAAQAAFDADTALDAPAILLAFFVGGIVASVIWGGDRQCRTRPCGWASRPDRGAGRRLLDGQG